MFNKQETTNNFQCSINNKQFSTNNVQCSTSNKQETRNKKQYSINNFKQPFQQINIQLLDVVKKAIGELLVKKFTKR